jgi:hypothetical protein
VNRSGGTGRWRESFKQKTAGAAVARGACCCVVAIPCLAGGSPEFPASQAHFFFLAGFFLATAFFAFFALAILLSPPSRFYMRHRSPFENLLHI